MVISRAEFLPGGIGNFGIRSLVHHSHKLLIIRMMDLTGAAVILVAKAELPGSGRD